MKTKWKDLHVRCEPPHQACSKEPKMKMDGTNDLRKALTAMGGSRKGPGRGSTKILLILIYGSKSLGKKRQTQVKPMKLPPGSMVASIRYFTPKMKPRHG
jgi:hypothetical protein